jgi:hypothetical protein
MNLRIFVRIAPSRRLMDMTTALDHGSVPQGWDPLNYPRLRSTFKLSRMHGNPILVAQRPSGPYTLIEGVTRMCVLLSKSLQGEIDLPHIPVVLGVSRRFDRWDFF